VNPPAVCMRCRHAVPALRSQYSNVVQLVPICEYCADIDEVFDSAFIVACAQLRHVDIDDIEAEEHNG